MSSFEKVRRILVENLAVESVEVKPEARLREDLHCDSLDKVELALACEDEFGIHLSDSDIEGFVTVRDIYTLIDKRVE